MPEVDAKKRIKKKDAAITSAVVQYLRSAPWPHGTACASAVLAVFLFAQAALLYGEHHEYEAAVLILWGLGWVLVCAFAFADGLARHREYSRIKKLLARHGYRERILHAQARSRCQRDAALLAAREFGHFEQAWTYYRTLGYRWYHVLPDKVMRNPFLFLSPRFLRCAFLPGKRARSKGSPLLSSPKKPVSHISKECRG